ncbi:hypothetical protein [Chitinibacter sp. GC72]|uniref:hypothetical protein n=1 Tax=Chitinibacter sp. GC72 TaxID=1526917 RepID=UPI0012FB929F|nr:hypothetical protein [Chitinibacter sp. GC72]
MTAAARRSPKMMPRSPGVTQLGTRLGTGLAMLAALLSPAAAQADDLDALSLADQTPQTEVEQQSWQFFTEGMLGYVNRKEGQSDIHPSRISLDLSVDYRFNAQWRGVLANRFDLNRVDLKDGQGSQHEQINTLKEAYLSWQIQPDWLLDAGRINQRNGMAYAYNPSDFFKAGALRSVVSIAPASLRENRLGSAMLRTQYLWEGGSLSALYAPRVGNGTSNDAQGADTGSFALDFASSNPADRWQLAWSQRWFDGFSPQLILFKEAGSAPRLGLNASWLASDALSLHAEYSGARSRSLAQRARQIDGEERFYSRLSSGATYTFPVNLSLTLEYQYNQAALDKAGWQALGQQGAAYGRYRSLATREQDNPTRHNLFMLASWNNALMRNLDLSLMLRRDLVDHSTLHWLEARYHFKRADLALQWQSQQGSATSQYGAAAERNSLQALIKYYF